jgi:hypothetical protein
MCSYNSINGVPSCASGWLLDEVARNDWGFDGYITSDCDADADVFNSHHYTKTAEEAVRDVLKAGTDVDCTSFVGQHALSALDKGLITEADLDARLMNLFKVRMRLNHFDPVGPLDSIKTDVVCSDEAQKIARDGTVQGSTLIKNKDKTLPLDASKLKSVAVLGPNANLSHAVAGYYGGNSCGNNYWTTTDAIRAYVPGAVSMPAMAISNDTSSLEQATQLSADSDATVLVLGTDLGWAAEGHDAKSISVPDSQMQLVESVTKATSGPVIVVLITATPLDISTILDNDKVGAVLHVGMPSVQTLGIGDIIFGTSSPSGRLIQTIYPASYADQISIFDFNMRPGPSVWPRPDCPAPYNNCPIGTNPGRTHRFYTGTPVVPFGFGLSYTTFSYELQQAPESASLAKLKELLGDNGKLSMVSVSASGPAVSYSVKVTNTGDVDADDVVLGFMAPPGAGQNGVPLQTLFGFERVFVKAGKSTTVQIYPEYSQFAQADLDGVLRPLAGQYKVWFGSQEAAQHGMGYVESKLQATLE